MNKGDLNTKWLDEGQFELMWNFLRMGYQKCNKGALRENCEALRQAMIQKTAGQRNDDPGFYINFDDIGTIINNIVIETMALYLSGGLNDDAGGKEQGAQGVL